MNKVLILGAGLVSKPICDYLLKHDNFEVTVASRTVAKAEVLVGGHERGHAIAFDITKTPEDLVGLIENCDIAVSLLPYIYHVQVANECIKQKKHLVTTSYVSAEMRALDEKAKEAGIIILNELGLDPGIDHMSAQQIIDNVHEKDGKIVSFRSLCGGLPAPEANDNPFGYKFSWSPSGVVRAGRNNAKYLEDGEIKEIPGKELFGAMYPFTVEGLGEHEAYPNRDSVPYQDIYHIEEAKTVFRGTLRNVGWCPTWYQFMQMNLPDETDRPELAGKSFADYTRALTGLDAEDGDALKGALAKKLGIDADHVAMKNMEWLGYFSNEKLPEGKTTGFDILVARLEEKLAFKDKERDMIVLVHEFIAEFADGKKERIMSTMIDYGIPGGDSAMSRTVSLPAAIGVRMICEDKIKIRGVHIPVAKNIYENILAELETMDIVCKETSEAL